MFYMTGQIAVAALWTETGPLFPLLRAAFLLGSYGNRSTGKGCVEVPAVVVLLHRLFLLM